MLQTWFVNLKSEILSQKSHVLSRILEKARLSLSFVITSNY